MLKAIVNGQEFISLESMDRKLDYRCPGCGEHVILKRGSKNIPHFAHEAHSACLFGAGETIDHLRAKAWLYMTMKNDPRCEAVDAECSRWDGIRPDVAFKLRSVPCWIGVEFQRSQISLDDIREREHRYRANGVILMWCVTEKVFWKICPRDAEKYDEIRLSDQIIEFIRTYGGVFGFVGDGIAYCEYYRVYRSGKEFWNPYTEDWMESEGRLLSKTGAIACRHKVDIFNLYYDADHHWVRDPKVRYSWRKVLSSDIDGYLNISGIEDYI